MKSTQAKLAAASGLAFVGIVVAFAIISEVKDFEHVSDINGASNEMWGSLVLLAGAASAALLWFVSTATARFRQVETGYGGSGRLSAAMFGSGLLIAGGIGLNVGVMYASRFGGADYGALSNALLEGPTLGVPIAVFLAAGGLVTMRAEGLRPPSPFLGRLALATSAAYGVLIGLQLFKQYAWINETGYAVFAAWILVMSVLGIARWGAIDGEDAAPSRAAPAAPGPLAAAAAPTRKPARKAGARKPAARKTGAARKR
ncbi:MAG: hypothetical protein WD646_02235 [Actinomycetota bacterium]